jgi:predicted CoA-binding protein
MKTQNTRVVVLGASLKPERYSNRAVKLLLKHGYEVLPIHPTVPEIEGLTVIPSLDKLSGMVDTLTIYVSPAISTLLKNQIIKLNPTRVIFNPGSENPMLNATLEKAGIQTEAACTLILLNTRQF